VDETVIMKIGDWKTRSVFIRYGIVATKDIENAMDLLQKNNGTLMEPDRNPAHWPQKLFCFHRVWSRGRELNSRPADYEMSSFHPSLLFSFASIPC
jgi:hypothetical protein